MRLSLLLNNSISLPPNADPDIKQLTLDSRKVAADYLFFAVRGAETDGRQFIENAIANGAGAILTEGDEEAVTVHKGVPLIVVPGLREHLGPIAARFYDHPSKALRMIGVTGTNGKTSCTHFIAQILQSFNIPCGIIGTLGTGLYGALGQAGLTTPDPISLQASLRQFVQQNAKAVAMEVSSHSIDQRRINGIDFEIGIFTNLTQDHLDYHGDMATYANVKRRFLADVSVDQCVVNADDPYGFEWLNDLAAKKPVFAYTMNADLRLPESISIIQVKQAVFSLQGIKAFVATPWGSGELQLPLIGQFNLSNALAVLTTLCLFGIPLAELIERFKALSPVPGRMQTIGGQDKPLVVVDYAHTPDALEKVLQALRAHTNGRLMCVFGCGGDRDPGKRPLMAKIAEQWADHVTVTNDNPRHENPTDIAQEICKGFAFPNRVLIELDRSQAIEKSIQLSSINDCILIAGKGAERYQQIGDQKLPFDDVEQVSSCLNRYGQ